MEFRLYSIWEAKCRIILSWSAHMFGSKGASRMWVFARMCNTTGTRLV